MVDVDPAIRPMRPSGLWGTVGHTVYPPDCIQRACVPVQAMTEEDIADVIAAYARLARNAIDVGFDGIAIHGGHGHLLLVGIGRLHLADPAIAETIRSGSPLPFFDREMRERRLH